MHGERLLHGAGRILVRERLGHARLPRVDREAGTIRNDDVREIEQRAPAVPRAEFEKRIRAEQQDDRALRAELAAQLGQRVERVAGAGASASRGHRR